MPSQQGNENETICSRFGAIAVEQGFLTPEKLKQGLNEQVEDNLTGRPHRVIGAICFTNDWMTAEQIDIVLNLMFKSRKKTGDQSVEPG